MSLYFLKSGEGETGPHTIVELAVQISKGTMTRETLCREIDRTEWLPFSEWMERMNAPPEEKPLHEQLRQSAWYYGVGAILAFVLGGVLIVVAFHDKEVFPMAAISGGLFSTGAWLGIMWQLQHIRAVLEEKNQNE